MKKFAQLVFAGILTFTSVSDAGGYVIGKDYIAQEVMRIGRLIYERLRGISLPGVDVQKLLDLLKKIDVFEVTAVPPEVRASLIADLNQNLPAGFYLVAQADRAEGATVTVFVDSARWEKLADQEKVDQLIEALLPPGQNVSDAFVRELTEVLVSASVNAPVK